MKYLELSMILIQAWVIITLAMPSLGHLDADKTSVRQSESGDLSPWVIWPGEEPFPAWDGQENYSDWESRVDFIKISALAHERTQQNVRDVCKSFDFTLSVENFYLSGAMDWLEKYTLTARNSKSYRERGLVGSIAYDYLGDIGFKCGLGSTSLCKVMCADVINNVNDLDEARAIFFVLKSAQHLNLVFNIVQKNLHVAQTNIGMWAPTISRIFYWAEPSSYEKTYKLLLGYLNVFIQLLIGSAAAFVQTSAILDLAENSLLLAQEHRTAVTEQLLNSRFHEDIVNLRAHLLHLEDVVHARQESLLAIQRRVSNVHGYGSSQWYAIGSPWFGVMAPQSMFDAISTYADFEGEVAAPEKNAANLMMYIQQSTAAIRVKLHESVDFIFAGNDIGTDGSTGFSKLIGAGGYLPVNDKALAKWTGPEIEENISRKILLKAIDGAFRSQQIWISCTLDFMTTEPRTNSYSRAKVPTTSCERDKSGPQDLKECVDGLVCYMYKWDSRGGAYRHQVERPFGISAMSEAPYGVSVKDIIYSSVKTHLATNLDELYPPSVNITNLGSPSTDDDLWSTRSAGTFSIPVCISTHNWMAPVEPVFDITCDTNPHCRKKYLPCNCGPWGKDTEHVWKETGLWTHKHARGEYKKLLCPRQIEEKIEDPLEKFVAYCRLEVRKTGLGGIIKRTGKHPLCDTIIETIETERDPILGTISIDLRTRLECAAGVIKEKYCRAANIIAD